MSLSNNIITHQLDPVLFNQQRCEFRLDPKVWLSNWRLADLGINQTGGTYDATTNKERNVRYASHLGAYALIDRIRLLNGAVEIAELRNVNQYLAFQNLQRTNANAFNVNRTLNKSSFALDIEGTTPLMDLKKYEEMDTVLPDSSAATPLSFLDLQQVLPFLKAQSYVLGTELQSLRLVIEWVPNTAAALKKVLVGETLPTSIEIIQPSLIIDEVADEATARKLKNVPIQYINMDHEVVNVASSTLAVNQRLRGFDDKLVRRMLMLTEDPNNAQPSSYLAGLTSYAMYNSKLQFSLNGTKMLNYNGIENENQQLAMLNDTFGTHILPQGAQMFDLANKTSLYKAHDVFNNAALLEANNLVGQMSYAGFAVNQSVDELQLEYQRSAFPGSPKNISNITSVAPDTTNTKFTKTHSFVVDDVISVVGVTGTNTPASIVAKVNGVQTVSAVNSTADFSIAVNTAPITAISCAVSTGATTPTVFTKADHGLVVGDVVRMTGFAGADNADVNNVDLTITAVAADGSTFSIGALDTHGKTISGTGTITPAFVGAHTKVDLLSADQKIARSKSQVNLLFWGECVKTLKVSNNNVQISNN